MAKESSGIPPKTGPRVGFFDSGIGGLTILAEAMRRRPDVEALYVADDAHAPYGPKSAAFVTERARVLSKLFWDLECDLVVVACNTATAVAVDSLRQEFPGPFVGVEPYLNYIHKVRERADQGRVAVLTTALTAKTARFIELKKRLDPQDLVHAYVSEHLAAVVEEAYAAGGVTAALKARIHAELVPLENKNLSTLILGCTHYPLVQDCIEGHLKLTCVSPAQAVADRIVALLPGACAGARTLPHYFFMATTRGHWEQRTPASTALWPSPR